MNFNELDIVVTDLINKLNIIYPLNLLESDKLSIINYIRNPKFDYNMLIDNLMFIVQSNIFREQLPCFYYDKHNCPTTDCKIDETISKCLPKDKNKYDCDILSYYGENVCKSNDKCNYDNSKNICYNKNETIKSYNHPCLKLNESTCAQYTNCKFIKHYGVDRINYSGLCLPNSQELSSKYITNEEDCNDTWINDKCVNLKDCYSIKDYELCKNPNCLWKPTAGINKGLCTYYEFK